MNSKGPQTFSTGNPVGVGTTGVHVGPFTRPNHFGQIDLVPIRGWVYSLVVGQVSGASTLITQCELGFWDGQVWKKLQDIIQVPPGPQLQSQPVQLPAANVPINFARYGYTSPIFYDIQNGGPPSDLFVFIKTDDNTNLTVLQVELIGGGI